MVLSHGKLKRKRREEMAALVASGAAIPGTSPSVTNAPGTAPGEGKKRKKKDKKKRKMDVVVEADVAIATSNGSLEPEEVPASMEKGKKKKKKKMNGGKTTGDEADDPLLSSVKLGIDHVDNRVEEAVRNGGDKAEQSVVENGAAAAAENGRPLSVREKKGKKKKGGKDRWGAKIIGDAEEEENAIEIAPVSENPPTSSTSGELYDLKKVFVGGMPYYTTEDDIHDYFSECGAISELDCMIFPDTGNFRGIAFITFKTEEGAAKSLEYDGADMGGRFLKIEKCKLKPQASTKNPQQGEVQKTPGSTSAYLGNLSWDITEEVIKNFFKKTYSNSKIDSIRLSFDKTTGEFKGFGHIDFGDDESLEAAVKLNQSPLLGRPLKIAYAVVKERAGGQGDRFEPRREGGACYNCGEQGHKSFLCPKKGMYDNDELDPIRACYSCGKEGHMAPDCPLMDTIFKYGVLGPRR